MDTVFLAGRIESIAQFLTVLLVFIFVLVLCYLTTRFIGGYQKTQMNNRNFEVIETMRIANGKFLQIVKVGARYVVIGISKDSITTVCELTEDELVFAKEGETGPKDLFSTVLDKAKEKISKKGDKNEK